MDDHFIDPVSRRKRWCSRYEDTNTPKWTNSRGQFMNATDTPCLLGFGNHSVGLLWEIKMGWKAEPTVPSHIQDIYNRGHTDEPVLVQDLLQTLPASRYTCFPVGRCISMEDKRVAATPDRLLWDHKQMEWIGVECKSRQSYNPARIPTLANYVQMQQQMWCAGTKTTLYICNNLADGPQAAVHCLVVFCPRAWSYIYNEIVRFFDHMYGQIRPGRNSTGEHRDNLLKWYHDTVFYRTGENQFTPVTAIPSDK